VAFTLSLGDRTLAHGVYSLRDLAASGEDAPAEALPLYAPAGGELGASAAGGALAGVAPGATVCDLGLRASGWRALRGLTMS
jgi:hypothetical protein